MKKLLCTLVFAPVFATGQISTTELIPADAQFVVGINSPKILQSASVEEIQQYEFMGAFIQDFLNEENPKGKTLNDLGIDFSTPFYTFMLADSIQTSYGICFKTNNIKIVEKWSDIELKEAEKSSISGWKILSYKKGHLLVKKEFVLLLHIEGNWQSVEDELQKITGDYPEIDYYDESGEPLDSTELEKQMSLQESYSQRRFDIQDSLEEAISKDYMKVVVKQISTGKTMLLTDKKFAETSRSKDEAFFYYNVESSLKNMMQAFNKGGNNDGDWQTLYKDQNYIFTGQIHDKSLTARAEVNYNKEMGKWVLDIANEAPNPKLINAIPSNAIGLTTFNFDAGAVFNYSNKAATSFIQQQMAASSPTSLAYAAWQIATEFIDTAKLFSTFKGNVFVSFNGLQEVKYKAMESVWNETDYTYEDVEVEREDILPVFAFGFASDRPEILEKIIHVLQASNRDEISGENGSYTIEKGLFNSMDVYVVNKKGVLVITNDKGYRDELLQVGEHKMSAEQYNQIMSAKNLYCSFDFEQLFRQFNQLKSLSESELACVDSLKEIMGQFHIRMGHINESQLTFEYDYTFKKDKNGLHHLLHIADILYRLDQHSTKDYQEEVEAPEEPINEEK